KKGLILVTNDEALLREAAVYGVRVWRGEEFVDRMTLKPAQKPEAGTEEDVQLSKAEVDEWLALFRANRKPRKKLKKRPANDGLNKPAEPQSKTNDKSSKKSSKSSERRTGNKKGNLKK